MRRNFILLFILLFFGFTASAQLENGSIGPDFTATDLEGNTWNLYELLDQGKTVYIDLMATWCPPCWSYKETGAFDDLWEMYGPDGTDEIMIFMVEADNSTTTNDLYGTGGNTIGDWVTGTPFPIIESAQIGNLYDLAYYPTIYMICPSRIVTEVGQVSTAQLYGAKGDCLQISGDNNGAILRYEGFDGAFCGGFSLTPEFTVQNLGANVLETATVDLLLNGAVAETVTIDGPLNTYEMKTVSFSEVTLTESTTMLAQVATVNGSPDENAADSQYEVVLNSAEAIESETITLEMRTDDYGYETYWEVVDEAGETIAEGGNQLLGNIGGGNGIASPNNPGAYANNQLIMEEIQVPANGCYEFIIVDDYGDGICCSWGQGYYRLRNGEGTIIAEGGEFEAEEVAPFERLLSSSFEALTQLNDLTVFPNPVREALNVNFNLTEPLQLRVNLFDATGRLVRTVEAENFVAGRHTLTVNTADLADGMYFLRIENESRQISSRFVVQR